MVVVYTAQKIIKPALCTYLCHKICYLLTITFYLSWGQIPNIQIQLRKIVQNKNEINTCFPLCSSDPSKNRQPAVSVDIFLPVIYIRFNQYLKRSPSPVRMFTKCPSKTPCWFKFRNRKFNHCDTHIQVFCLLWAYIWQLRAILKSIINILSFWLIWKTG